MRFSEANKFDEQARIVVSPAPIATFIVVKVFGVLSSSRSSLCLGELLALGHYLFMILVSTREGSWAPNYF